ncbi:MAG: hypothetical protein ACYC6Y_29490 [Thermoguttaceae bacterium]
MPGFESILVDCISLHHHYRGWLRTNGTRLSDELNKSQSDFVTLREVQITAAGHTAPLLECSELTLLKERILIAMPHGDRDAPPAERINKFQKKDRHGVVVVLPGHVISGVMQLPRTAGTWSLLRESGVVQRFIGLTGATVHNAVFRLAPKECAVAIIQRDAVEAIELTAGPLKDAPSLDALAADR